MLAILARLDHVLTVPSRTVISACARDVEAAVKTCVAEISPCVRDNPGAVDPFSLIDLDKD